MINWLKKLWNWLKSLFNGSSDGTETDETPSKPRLSDAEYENVLFALLAAIKKGRSWGSCQGFLISRKVKPDELAEWMKEKSLQWLDNSDNYEQLGQDLEELGNIASGKLGNIARKVSSELGVRGSELGNFQGNNLQNTESNPTTSETQNITPSQTTTDEVQRLIDQSVEQYQRGEYQEAVNTAVGITQQYPNDDQGWYYLGELMGTFQQYEQAITSYDKALQLKPDYYEAWTNRGVALRNLGRFDEAIASYDKALQLKPDYYEAWVYRGNALDELRRLDEAIASYDKALQLKPDDHLAWTNRGIVLLKLGSWDEAIASYDKALQLKPDDHEAWTNRGSALFNLGRFDEVIASCDKALQLKPDDHLAWTNRGVALRNLGRFDEAIASYDKALQLKPDYYEAWVYRGNALDELRRLDEAIASYDKALQLKPDSYEAWYNRGNALLNLGRFDEAIASYDKALQLKRDYHLAWYSRGNALSELGRFDEAIASYDKALQLKRDYHLAWYNRGTILCDKLRRFDEAITSFEKTLEIKPDYDFAWCSKGIALGYLKRFDEAIASYDKALQLKPDAHKPWLGRGIVLLKLGRWDEAIASYDKALQLKPDDDLTWFNRGVALGNLGRWDEAIASFDKALQLKPDSYEAWNNRGIALGKLGRLDEAIGSYDKALQLKPDLHQTWNNRGIASSSSTASEGEILRVESQFIDTFQMELTDASRQLINYFQSLETGDFGDLISFLQQPNSDKLIQFLDQSQLQSISRLNPQLNIRGYEGQLISYRYPLNKHIYQDSHPEGWGYLHHKIGVAQYEHQEYDNAINNYHCALETLTVEQFPELRLGVIQDLVKVYLAVGDKGKADDYLLQGLKLLNQLLDKVPIAEKNQRLRLEAKFLTFRQLTVNVLLEKGEIIEALRNAELEKNRRLTHILEGYKTETQLETESNIYPSYEQIQTLLNHEKAIIYWFNSPMGLITFIIKQNGLITLNPNPSLNPNLEQWIKEWDEDYQDYRSKKDEEIEDKKEHPWRINISDRLEILKEILGISEIEKDLENIEELILIPHQDLHRLPLHYLFNEKDWIISYLPSLQIGLNLKQKQQQLNNSQKESLLSIENPRRDLVFSEIESGIINTYFATIKSSIITIEDFKNAIPNYTHLHFTGHGYYLFDDPERSALEFIDESKKETTQLTAYEISHLNFNSYELITLSACETALNGKQTINSEYVGLVSAFLKSGANCVVSTLWTVDETSSAWLMIYFYQQYRAENTPKIALENAQTWLTNVTYEELYIWLTELLEYGKSKQVNRTILDLIEDEINRNKQNNPSNRPYEEPYYWLGFLVHQL